MICVTHVGRAGGSRPLAAALACALAEPGGTALLVELADGRAPRPALVASDPARRLEERLTAHLPEARAASRGCLCHLALPAGQGGVEALAAALAVGRGSPVVVHLPPSLLRPALDRPGLAATGALLRADLAEDRALTALVARELIGRGLRVGVAKRPAGWAVARLALLGALPAGRGGALPVPLVARLATTSHSCYITQNGPRADTARASQQERGDHAGAGSW